MNYPESLTYLMSLADFERTGRFNARVNVEPMLALLAQLGDPHLGRTTIHIAGSKGKGSVAAMTASILQAAGLSTGLYTSPHLCRFTERIQIDGTPVTPDEFGIALTEVRAAVERVQAEFPGRQLVTFDVLTALGFYLFRQHEVQAQVIEVGLGGLLDSTNVFEKKESTVITSIGLEHQEILGDTIAEIARQKAGIIVPGSPVVMAPQRESAAEVIRAIAQEKRAPLQEVALACNLRRDNVASDSQGFRLRTPSAGYQVKLPLTGKHQLDNAATAVLAIESLAGAGIKIPEEAIKSGLEGVSWPGRIEVIKRRPLIIVDSAHTTDSARRLRDTLAEYQRVDQAILVVGVMGDKDLEGLVSAIEPVARQVIATAADHPRALSPETVARAFQSVGIETTWEPRLSDAIDTAVNLSTPSGTVVILGSVALAGEARAHILGLERDPPVTGS